jgi:hypothetical protein
MKFNASIFRTNSRYFLLAPVGAALLLFLSGCTSMDGKFSKTKSENLGPFASQTIAIIGESDFGFSEQRGVYIREFLPRTGTEYELFLQHSEAADRLFRSIINYSLKIVAVSESQQTQEQKVFAYADYVAGFRTQAIKRIGATTEDQRVLVDEIRNEDTYLNGLQAAQPMIDTVTNYGEDLLFDMEENVAVLERRVSSEIDKEYEILVEYTELLEDKRNSILFGLQKVYEYENGDAEALQRLIESNIIRSKKLSLKKDLSEEDLRKIEAHLVARLESLTAVADKIEPDWERYRQTHAELDRLTALVLSEVRGARLALLTWERAHNLMSNGKTDPAEWFSLSDAPGALVKIGTKAVF